MSPRTIGRIAAAGRVLIGSALTVMPASGGGWIGEVAGESPVKLYGRALGVRDAAIGVGVLGLLLVLLGLLARRSDIVLQPPAPEITVTTSPR